MWNRRAGIQRGKDFGQWRCVGERECAIAGPAEFLEMRDGAERDANVARERSRIGAGSAYRDEAKRVGAVGVAGELEVFDLDAADFGRFYVLASAREPIERDAGALNRGVHRGNLV